MMPGVLESTVAEVKEAIEQLGKAENIERARIDAKLAEVDAAKDKFSKEPPIEMIEQLRTPWPRPEMIELIYFMTRRCEV